MTTSRRTFFKVAGAAVLGTQLNRCGKAAVKPKGQRLSPGTYVEPDFVDKDGTGYYGLKPTTNVIACRRVIFLDKGEPIDCLPKVGTIISSPDGKYLFTVPEQADILPIIPHTTKSWDEETFGAVPGITYEGVSMVVEAVAPGENYATCPIRTVVTPSAAKHFSVCEDWRVPYRGGIWSKSYEPGCTGGLAFDALYPEYTHAYFKASKEILNSRLVYDHDKGIVILQK